MEVISGTTENYLSDNQTFAYVSENYIVNFDPQGGNVSPTSKSVSSGGTYGTLPTPTRPGYVFVGWYTSPLAGTLITEGSAAPSASETLYARWVSAGSFGASHLFEIRKASALVPDSVANANIDTGGAYKIFSFVPPETGDSILSSSSSGDTYGYLLDQNGVEIAHDDDNGPGNNFQLVRRLDKDTRYYCAVRYYGSSTTGTIPVLAEAKATSPVTCIVFFNTNGGNVSVSSKPKAGKKQVKITWKKAPAAQKVSGYQVQYRQVGTKKWQAKTVKAKAASLTIEKLKPGKKYEVRVRAYTKSGGKIAYGPWSKTYRTGKVKK
jgi:uncharacterized repeat protein (TIGR02543 family)